jgi:phosphopantothenoylcysteine decarboxylase/phosphopantothenate--cysteine ligase
MLKGKKILLCVTGSIAAYKAVLLLRLFIKAGAEVKVIMTKDATNFVAPLTFSTLSKNKVLTDLAEDETWVNHVLLGRWADVMIIAPASCNTISKMANGLCDNLLLAVYLSSTCPVYISPAMDEDMWRHPATQNNINQLEKNGNKILPVKSGDLASGLTGKGRMAEPEEIFNYLSDYFSSNHVLKGKNVLVTAGPTYEAIDPVRFIGNHSSGKMGVAIAEEFSKRGANVKLVLGPSEIAVDKNIFLEKVLSADQMYDKSMDGFESQDIIVMAAAVADYKPSEMATNKIKKEDSDLNLRLVKTKDILQKAGNLKSEKQTLVGFALETNDEKNNALKKLSSKNLDMIVLNSLNDDGAGFGFNTNKISIFDKKGNEYHFPLQSKKEVAEELVNKIIDYRNG